MLVFKHPFFRTSELHLEGLNTNVQELTKNVENLLDEMKEAVALSEHVVWKWTDSINSKPLPLRVSRGLEICFKKCLNQVHFSK